MDQNCSVVSLGRFKEETKRYQSFFLTYENPLSPVNISVFFNRMAVALSASPYIALRNNNISLCLSHLVSIQECWTNTEEKCFALFCNDYSILGTPTPTKFLLRCRFAS